MGSPTLLNLLNLQIPTNENTRRRPTDHSSSTRRASHLTPEVIAFKRHAGCREVTFPQCSFGSTYRKMTTFLLTPALGHILGDLSNLRCTHTHHEQRAGGERDAQGT